MVRLFKQVALVSMLSSILLWLLELFYALVSGAWVVRTAEGVFFFLLLSLLLFAGWGVVTTVVQSAYLSAIISIHRRLARLLAGSLARVSVSIIVTATFLPYIFYFNQRLFSGRGISRFAYVSCLKAGFVVVAVLAVYGLAFLVIKNASSWFSPMRRLMRNLTIIFSIAGLLILYAVNAEFYAIQYGFIHQGVSLALFLIAEFIIINLLGKRLLAEPLKKRLAKGLLFLAFLMPLEMSLLTFTVGGSPGSQQLSYIYSQTHLGRQLVWIYGFRSEMEKAGANYYREYLALRDNFVRSAPRMRRRGCNLIWIMVDALRADHLPMYGYGRNTSPHMKAFAQKSLLFLYNYVQGIDTKRSLPAQMTGCYISTVQRGGGLDKFEILPEMLLSNGYNTWALMQSYDRHVLEGKGREGVAFEKIESLGTYPAPEISRRAIELIEEDKKGKPFFLFLFYAEPHLPHVKHDAFDYGNRAEDLYDSEISYVDRHIGKLLDYLWSTGLYLNTVILVTADHGEGLGQHGNWGHGWTLYNTIIHVPLILYIPDVRPAVITAPVQSIDICPSIVELLDLDTYARFDGSTFLPYVTEGAPPYDPLVFSELESNEGPVLSCLIDYPMKLIYNISDSYFSVYNLEEDPQERVNRIEVESEVAALLKRKLLSWQSYRDRDVPQATGAGNHTVAAIINRLRDHDAGVLQDLQMLDGAEISARDFKLLVEAIEPYVSRHVASFYLAMAGGNEEMQALATSALRTLVWKATVVLWKNVSGRRHDEAVAIFEALSDDSSVERLVSLVEQGRDPVLRNSLYIIGLVAPPSIADDLFMHYDKGDPELRERLFPVLCRLGDSRIEDELFEKIEGLEESEDLPALFVNFKSNRCRDFLMELLERSRQEGSYINWMYPLTNEIGKSRNPCMLPVLRAIFCYRVGPREVWSGHAPFCKKLAIFHFVSIKGEENLSADDKRAIKKACESDVHLDQFQDLKRLYESL